jgi:amino acid adenylation domain-containing protein
VSAHETEGPLLDGVAIIGMSGRWPGAASVRDFWQNQLRGIEAVSHFRLEELEVPNAAELMKQPNYIPARSILKDIDLFDAEFFGILPREAEIMDPQQRLFLECCWETFEDAGYDPLSYPGSVGVYAGTSISTYFLSRIAAVPGFIQKYTGGYQVDNYPQMMGNNPDFLATRVSYKFNLRGPSFTMQAGCSTSLLAVCQACQSLLTYQSDMALAGGTSITLPQKRGYFYQDGGMGSADGHTRTFDADAQGTVFGSGVAVVLLKRLEDAVRDGDQIYAVIRGFGMNNDGSAKVGYTAPSVEGQANVIALAHAAARVNPATIGYVEAHGTGTPLGDPIELAALTKAFSAGTDKKGFCVVGTAKTNVGHLDIAAGATGLINAANILRSGKFPPTLHFKKPSDKFDLANSPFYVNTQLADWKSNGTPRRAGVSAFGVGGTNAHVILEQAPHVSPAASLRPTQLLVISARSAGALNAATQNLVEHFKKNPVEDFADAAFTLQVGRRAFDHRRILVARDSQGAASALATGDARQVFTRGSRAANAGVCFLFPGQGSQQPNMGRELYETERVFHEEVDRCAKLLTPHLGLDLRTVLYPAGGLNEEARDRVTQTILAQPAIFTVEYALANLWMSWGIQPRFMLGHSVGEFVAACLAGVFSLADALQLIAARGRMMQALPNGAMLSVRLSEGEVRPLLNERLSLAALNSPSLCVVAGPIRDVAELENELTRRDIVHRRLHTSHAFHSSMMDPILEPFTAEVRKIRLNPPKIPYLSSVTGNWIATEEATNPLYWARHFREAVQFSKGIAQLREREDCILLEVGPGNVLTTLARQHPAKSAEQIVVSSLTDGTPQISESVAVQQALGWLWLGGVQPAWTNFHDGAKRRRISLPTYPFERKHFWLEAPQIDGSNAVQTPEATIGTPAATPAPVDLAAKAPTRFFPHQENNPMTQSVIPPATQPRKDKLRAMLGDIFQDLSGVDIAKADNSATFLELGFDSLFLTQVTQALQSKFHLKITFRQLLGYQSTLDALASYVDDKLPAGMFDETAQTTAPSAVAAPSTASAATPVPLATPPSPMLVAGAPTNGGSPVVASAIEQLLRDQIQAMNLLFAQQLAAVQGRGGLDSVTVPATAPLTVQPTSAPAAAVSSPNQLPLPAAPEAVGAKELKGYTPFKPLQKSVSGELTSRQEKYIRDLIERYTKRTPSSKARTQEYRKVLADPRVVSGFRTQWKEMVYPIITDRSKGSHLWDLDGNEYVDILNGFGPIMLGHRPDYVEKAVEKQLREGFEIGPQSLLACEVAKALCEMTGNERATFCNTGSEAVVAAMRVARTVTGRSKVVFFAGDYHGMFDEVLVKGFKKGGVPQAVPAAPGIPREKAANVVVLEYGAPESLEWIRSNAKDLAAVLVEPVQSRHPNLQPVEFLRELRKITQESDACLIFDEVVTGFRVHPGGCQALFDIRADLATYGKVLAGGMPIGVLAGKAKYMDALDGGMWRFGDDSYPEVGVTFFAGTFVRHPLTMAACAAVLRHLKREGPSLQERLSKRTEELVQRLNGLLERNRVPTHIENFASIFYFSFPTDFSFGSLFYYSLREKGIHVLENFPCFLTTEHTDADLERIVRAFEETIAEMQAGEILSEPLDNAPVAKFTGTFAEVTSSAASPQWSEAPVTESQLEVWLSDQLGKEASCSYNESFTLHMRGSVNDAALRDALRQVIGRHDALRATFDAEGKIQRFAPKLDLEIPIVDLSTLSPEQRQARLQHMIKEDAHTPFNLGQGPLVRLQLVKMEPDYQLLIFTSHHIVCDGWSTNVLLDELAKLYNALNKGIPCPDLPRAVSFAAYSRSQADFFKGPEGAENEKFWIEQFREIPPYLDLPTDRLRPAVKEFKGATYRKTIGAGTYNNLKRMGAREKCTLFVTLLAGLQVLLSRLTGQDDIVVGIPSAGQSLVEEGVLVGHCVNFLPLRGRTTGNPTAADYLAQVRQSLLAAYDHQNYTYGRLVRKLTLPRDPSRLPLTEVQFNLERVGDGLGFDGFEVAPDPNPKSFVNFDIFLNVVESKDGLVLDCDYNTGLYEERTIERWLGHYETLLEGMAADVHQPILKLPLLNERDRRILLIDWNATSAEFQRNACIHQLFEAQAKATPDAVAAVFENQELSYAELDLRANQLAHHLRKLGVGPGTRVAVFVERSMEMLVGLLGTLKAGGAYVPIDSTFPAKRLQFVLEDAKVPVVLTQDALFKTWTFGNAKVVRLDKDWDIISEENPAKPVEIARAEDLAYVIFTSGSTGRPKGVEVQHRAVVNFLLSMKEKPGLANSDTLAAVTTLSFDIAGLELYLPLCVGAKLLIVNRATAADGMALLNYLRENNVTAMQATPVTWKMLLEAGWDGNPHLKVLCGGEAFPRELANDLVTRARSVWNMYGPTETTIWSAVAEVTPGEGPVLIGPPIANTQFYVLDSQQQLAPIGIAGELCIGGEGLAVGYLDRPELTAEKFLPDPFSKKSGARIYRTGDLVRRFSDGKLEFLGRLDHQVKLRGFRIELGEIETGLARYPGVREAVVTVREDVPGDKRLVAYVTTDQQALAVTAVREFLTGKLPNYMLPSAVVRMDAMPVTPNGKIDRKALPAPDSGRSGREKEFVAPRTEKEKTLATIWAEVLRLERVGTQDNLFELGADSLHIFQIAARANKAGISIAPAQYLKYRTITSLLAQLEKEPACAGKTDLPRIVPVSREKYRLKPIAR